MKPRTRRRLSIVLLAIIVLGVGVAGAALLRQRQREAVIDRARETGMAAFERGDYADAARDLGYFVGQDSTDDAAMLAFARSLIETSEPRTDRRSVAISTLRVVVDRQDSVGEAHRLLMSELSNAGMTPELEALAARVLASDPEDQAAVVLRVRALLALARPAEAIELAQTHAERVNNGPAWGLYFQSLYAADTSDEDRAALALGVIERDATPLWGRLIAANALVDTGDIAAPTRVLRSTLDGDASPEALREAVLLAERIAPGRPDLADLLDELLASASTHDDDTVRLFAAMRYWKRDDARRVLETLSDAAEDPSSSEVAALGVLVLISLDDGDRLDRQDQLDRAALERALDATEGVESDRWRALIGGYTAHHAGDTVLARAAFEDLAGGPPHATNDIARWRLSMLLAGAQELDASRELLAGLAADPSWRRARLALARLEGAQGRWTEAIETMQREPTLSRWPIGVETLARLALGAAESHDRDTESRSLALRATEALRGQSIARDALRVRALIAAGQVSDAEELLASLAPDDLADLVADDRRPLARAISEIDAELALRLTPVDRSDRRVIQAARTDAAEGRLEEAIERLDRAIAAGAAPSLSLRVARASLLDAAGDSGASDRLIALAEASPESPEAQIGVLDSIGAWNDPDAIEQAISRLRELTGTRGVRWRVAESRLRLDRASDADASEALMMLEGVLAENPEHAPALFQAHRAAIQLDDQAAALTYATRAHAARPNHVGVHVALIAALERAGRPAAAAREAQALAGASPTSREDRRARAAVLERFGLWAQALEDRARLSQATGDPADLLAEADVLARLGDIDASRTAIERALSGDATAQDLLAAATTLARLGDAEAALEALARRASIAPDATEQSDHEIDLLIELGRYEDALARLESILDNPPARPRDWSRAARLMLLAGDRVGAHATASRGAAAHPDDVPLRWLERETDPGAPPSSIRPLIALTLTRALHDPWAGSDHLAELCESHLAGEVDVRAFERSLADHVLSGPPDYVPYQLLAAVRGAAMGDAAGVAQAYVSAMEALPGETRPARDAALALYDAGQYEAAADAADRWSRTTGQQDVEATWLRGASLGLLGRHRDTIDALEPIADTLLHDEPGSVQACGAYVAALVTMGRSGEAAEQFADRIAQTPLIAALGVRALSRTPQLEPVHARTLLELAAGSLGADPDGRLLLATSWYRVAQATGEQADHRQLAQVVDPDAPGDQNHARTWLLSASGHLDLGELEAAITHFRRCIERDPRLPDAWNNLSDTLIRSAGDPREAVEAAERAVQLADQTPTSRAKRVAYHHTLAQGLLKAGERARAIEVIESGLELDPASEALIGLQREASESPR